MLALDHESSDIQSQDTPFDRGESSFGLGNWPVIIAGGVWLFLLYFFGVFSWRGRLGSNEIS